MMKKILLPFLFFLTLPFFVFANTFASIAGTMDLTPVSVCQGGSTVPAHNGDEVLEPGDALAFVLHDSQGATLGAIFSIQFGASPVFEMNANMSFNTTYYLSAIAGTDMGSGIVDLSDPDVSVSNGTPVVFLESIPVMLDSTICEGDTIEIAGEFYTQAGNYNIELTDAQGCDSIIDLTVTVPNTFVSIFTNGFIDCNNQAVTILSNFNGSGNVTYDWFGPGIIGPNNTQTVQVIISGPYTLQVTIEENGVICTGSSTTFVEEDTFIPIADAGPDQTLDCSNGTAVLEANGGQNWGNCEEYFWTSNNGFSGSGISITVTDPGTYTLEVINFCNGCSNFDQVEILDGGGNQLEIGNDITMDCFNTPVVIEPNIINTNAGVTYNWTTTDGNIVSGSNTTNPTVDLPGLYVLEVDNGSCVTTDEVEVISFATGADAGEDVVLTCGTTTAILGGPNTATGANISYEWINFNGNLIGTFMTESVNTAGTYTLVVTDNASGCTATDEVIVEVDTDLPTVIVTSSGILDCSNTAVTLDGTGSSTGNPISYSWSDVTGIVIGTSPVITVTNPGFYTLTVTNNDNGCTATDVITVFENFNLPVANVFPVTLDCSNDYTATFQSGGTSVGPDFTYFWTGPNNFNSTVLEPTISGVSSIGTYILTVADNSSGCTSSTSVTVNSEPTTFDVLTTEAACNIPTGIASVITSLSNPTFAWSNGASSQSISGLLTGWYSVTVTDQNSGCGQHRNFFIEEDISCKVTIGGYIAYDPNMTCTYNNSMETIPEVMVKLEPLGIFTYSNADGYYEFVVEDGDYTVEYIGSSFTDLLCPVPGEYTVSLPNGSASTDNHFFVSRKDQDLCLSKSIGPARPGFRQFNCVMACNYGGNSENAVVTFTHDPLFAEVTPLPNIDPINTNAENYSYDPATFTFSWTLNDLQPGDCRKIMFYMNVPVTAMLGDVISTSAKVNPVSGDTNPDNNCLFWNTILTNSYDPNDKRNMIGDDPFGGGIGVDDIQMDYSIRFQNVGTDTAITVVIRDTIDTDVLDVTTIRGITASHDYSLEFEGHNVLIFRFENIYLVDSMTNEPESNGWVDFTIDRYPGLPIGTEIGNQAAIYFDFNEPVITNEIINTIESHFFDVAGVIRTEESVEVENVEVKITGDINLNFVTNANGEILLEEIPSGSELNINLEKDINLLNGVTTFDLVLLHKHIIGTQPLNSPYKLIAADANHSGHITTHDIVVIKSAILQITDEFPDNTSWRFVDGDYTFTDPTDPFVDNFPESISIPNLENDRMLDVVGIKIGDLNGSAQPDLFVHADDRDLSEKITIAVDNQEVRVGEEVLIPFIAKDFASIHAFQFTLEFAKEKLEFEGFERGVLENMSEHDFYFSPHLDGRETSDNGKLTCAYASTTVQSFQLGEPLFYLKFKILENTSLDEVLKITENPTDAIGYDEFGEDYNITLAFDKKDLETTMNLYPNPTSSECFVNFNLVEEDEVSLEIYNSFGQLERVIFQNQKYQKGVFKEKINLDELSLGTYFIYLKTENGTVVKRVVKVLP